MGGNSAFKSIAEGRGKDSPELNPENVYLVGIDGDEGKEHPLYDETSCPFLHRVMADPKAILTEDSPDAERFRALILSIAFAGVNNAGEARQIRDPKRVEGVKGRNRACAVRVLNRIVSGQLKAPKAFADAIFQAMRDGEFPAGHVYLMRFENVEMGLSDLELSQRVQRDDLSRRSYTEAQRFEAIAKNFRAQRSTGKPSVTKAVSALGIAESEVRSAFAVLSHGVPEVIEAVKGGLSLSAGARFAAQATETQAASLRALQAQGDVTVAAVNAMNRELRADAKASAAPTAPVEANPAPDTPAPVTTDKSTATATNQPPAVKRTMEERVAAAAERVKVKRAPREGLSLSEIDHIAAGIATMIENPKNDLPQYVADLFALIAKGPSALKVARQREFGLRTLVLEIEGARKKKAGASDTEE